MGGCSSPHGVDSLYKDGLHDKDDGLRLRRGEGPCCCPERISHGASTLASAASDVGDGCASAPNPSRRGSPVRLPHLCSCSSSSPTRTQPPLRRQGCC